MGRELARIAACGALLLGSANCSPGGSRSFGAPAPGREPVQRDAARDGTAKVSFLRPPPHSNNEAADAIDACTQVGGSYFSCRQAWEAEERPRWKRYLYRIAQGHAAGVGGYVSTAPRLEGSMPHAEVPALCVPSLPCGADSPGGQLNDGVACLARAQQAFVELDPAAARAAHAHACRCATPTEAFPAYNRTAFICRSTQPAFLAADMPAEEGRDIIACAICHPDRGPPACRREVARSSLVDPQLADFIADEQWKRCSRPSRGAISWAEWEAAERTELVW